MEKNREPELRLFDSSEELNSCLADYVCQISESAVRERGSFSLVLSGGDIPKSLGFVLALLHTINIHGFIKWHVIVIVNYSLQEADEGTILENHRVVKMACVLG